LLNLPFLVSAANSILNQQARAASVRIRAATLTCCTQVSNLWLVVNRTLHYEENQMLYAWRCAR
jgi:hypothetical protein